MVKVLILSTYSKPATLYKEAWKKAGHQREPMVSVADPYIVALYAQLFGLRKFYLRIFNCSLFCYWQQKLKG